MQFLGIDERTAKKKVRLCDWCGEDIAIGDKYIDERAICEGGFQALKFHPECKKACSEVWRIEKEDCDLDLCGYQRGSIEPRERQSSLEPERGLSFSNKSESCAAISDTQEEAKN